MSHAEPASLARHGNELISTLGQAVSAMEALFADARRAVAGRLTTNGASASRALDREQRALAREAPAVAAGRSVAAHHSMAGHDDGDGIGGDRLRYCARAARQPEATRKFAVAQGLSGRYTPQRIPDPMLKRSAAQVERQLVLKVRAGSIR